MITSKFQVPDDDFPAKSSRHRVATEDFLTNKDLSEMKSTKVFSVFGYIKLFNGVCSSYGFYLHMRLLKPSNNFIKIVLMR